MREQEVVWNAGIRGMACGNRSGVECWDKGNGVREQEVVWNAGDKGNGVWE